MKPFDRLFVATILLSLLSSFGLLATTFFIKHTGAMPLFFRMLFCMLLSPAVSMVIYIAMSRSLFERSGPARWLAYLAIAICMLPTMVPVGLFAGALVASTGVWDDPVGSHSDANALGPLGLGILGLLTGPFWSIWGVWAAVHRARAQQPGPDAGDRTHP